MKQFKGLNVPGLRKYLPGRDAEQAQDCKDTRLQRTRNALIDCEFTHCMECVFDPSNLAAYIEWVEAGRPRDTGPMIPDGKDGRILVR